jgi:hypothetical protein
MDWLKLFYGIVGAKYPTISAIVVFVVVGGLATLIWLAIGAQYNKDHVLSGAAVGNDASPRPEPAPSGSNMLPAAVTAAFVRVGDMATPHQTHTSTLLRDGSVLVAGGNNPNLGGPSAELYDADTHQFRATGSMLRNGRMYHSAVLLTKGVRGGEVFIVGGVPDSKDVAELYDPREGKFHPVGSAIPGFRPVSNNRAVVLPDGRVLILWSQPVGGGISRISTWINLYDPRTDQFSPARDSRVHREGATLTLLKNGKILLAGGNNGWVLESSAILFDPKTFIAEKVIPMITARQDHVATLLDSGEVLLTGGMVMEGSSGKSTAKAELYDPKSNSFVNIEDMRAPRQGHTATVLTNDKVLIAGGNDVTFSTSAELYDPKLHKFSGTGPMVLRRSHQCAIRLSNGDVLLTGGDGPNGPTATAEVYRPE